MERLDREEIMERGLTVIIVTEETISTLGCPVETKEKEQGKIEGIGAVVLERGTPQSVSEPT